MGNAHPREWAHDRRHRLKQWATGDVGRWTREARDVCLPGVPVAAILGFFANGKLDENTTGWIACSDEERADAVASKRFPLKRSDPSDREVYGNILDTDLHELGPGGVEADCVPTPVATGACPWVSLATSAEVVKVLGREGVTGAAWHGAHQDQVVIGVANLRRHLRAIRAKLDLRLRWDDEKPIRLWGWCCAMTSWSAGGGGTETHVEAYTTELAVVDEARRWGEFCRLAAAEDSEKRKHRADEYSALRSCQKLEAGRLACAFTQEDAGWFLDGSDADRAEVYARLVAIT